MNEHLSIPTEINRYYNEIISNSSSAVFGYEGFESRLKVVGHGDDDLESLLDELDEGKILYAFLRVLDENTRLPKFCPDGAPIKLKGAFNAHVQTVGKFLKGFHVQINARDSDDVTRDIIMKKVKDSSGAKYSGRANEANPSLSAAKAATVPPTAQPSPKSGFVSKPEPKTPAVTENQTAPNHTPAKTGQSAPFGSISLISGKSEDSGAKAANWNPFHGELSSKSSIECAATPTNSTKTSTTNVAAKPKAFSPSINWIQPPVEKGNSKISLSTSSLSSQTACTKPAAGSTTALNGDSQGSMQLNPLPRQEKAVSVSSEHISTESTAQAARNFFKHKEAASFNESSRASAQESPRASFSKGELVGSRSSVSKLSSKSLERFTDPPAPAPEKKIVIEKERSVKDLSKIVAQTLQVSDNDESDHSIGIPHQENDSVKASSAVAHNAHAFKDQVHSEEPQQSEQPAAVSVVGECSAVYEYASSDPTEISLKVGQRIRNVQRVESEGWLYGETENGAGLFPEAYVQFGDAGANQSDNCTAGSEAAVYALYDYQAAEDSELSLVAGQEISNVSRDDPDWWHGEVDGKFGYFPSSYVATR